MNRIRKLAVGGIRKKVFFLLLLTVLLLTAAFVLLAVRQGRILSEQAAESGERQQESISEVTVSAVGAIVAENLERSNLSHVAVADAMFTSAANRVSFMADRVRMLLTHPDSFPPKAYFPPNPEDDGRLTAKVLVADGVDINDPAVSSKVGLIANLGDTMISVCRTFGATNLFIGIPEGVHYSVSGFSSTWFTDGSLKSFDPRTRPWYRKAVETGGLAFTDGEWDANTGSYCIECAMPVYGPDGGLLAVVGTDLFLSEMNQTMLNLSVEGEYFLLVNGHGCPVLEPQAADFPMDAADRTRDLRKSGNPVLSQAVTRALQGEVFITSGPLAGNQSYYVAASPIKSTGWVLISAFSEEVATRPAVLLQEINKMIQAEATESYREKTGRSAVSASVLLGLVLLFTLGGALWLGKRIVRPLNTITRRVSEMRDENLEFKMEPVYKTGDEVEELARTFEAVSHRNMEYLDTVRRVTAEKERLGAELSLATRIQASMLPHAVPAFPGRTDFDILGSMDPAKEVGGDFYDYFLIDGDHLCMVIADVSGKGVPAALFMMAAKNILQSVAAMGKSPAEILEKTNQVLCSGNDAQMFVTIWLGILELSTGRLTAANAGHEYPVIMRPGGKYELYMDRHGFVIGGLENMKYGEYEIRLEPGAKLFLYTDGVPEATNTGQELFGTDRMLDVLNEHPEASIPDVLKYMHAGVDAFVNGAEQFDDLTMVCMEYKGENREMKEMTLPATVENLPVVTAFIDEQLEAVGCPIKTQMQLDVAVDELFVNIASYAYPDKKGDATVRFDYDSSARVASITFEDSGVPFDPLAKPDPDTTLAASERQIGGLGIFMVKKTMDKMEYRYENGRNILTISKQF